MTRSYIQPNCIARASKHCDSQLVDEENASVNEFRKNIRISDFHSDSDHRVVLMSFLLACLLAGLASMDFGYHL